MNAKLEKRMSFTRRLGIICVCLLLTPTVLKADPVFNVVASPAPNFSNLPAFQSYNVNALNSLENGLGDIGDRGTDPAAYETYADGSSIGIFELIVSNFNSWRGQADPSSPFDNQLGNRLHFGVHIVGDGSTQFRLEDLQYEIDSTDDVLDFSGDFVGQSYSEFRIGIDWGADRAKGGGDDLLINSGAATQFVDELVYVGVGNAYDASNESGVTDQDKIDSLTSGFTSPVDVTGSYTLNDDQGSLLGTDSTTVTIVPVAVPEPASSSLAFLMGIVVTCRRRKRA